MRKADVEPGTHYLAMVSGRLVVVRVDKMDQRAGHGSSWLTGNRLPSRCVLTCTNLRTGREVTMTPARLRRPISWDLVERYMEIYD